MLGDFLYDILLFALKAVLVLVVVSILLALLFSLARKGKDSKDKTKVHLEIKDLTQELASQRKAITKALKQADPERKLRKDEKEQQKGWFAWFKRRKKTKNASVDTTATETSKSPTNSAATTSAEDGTADAALSATKDNAPQGKLSKLERHKAQRAQKLAHIKELQGQGTFCPRNLFVLDFMGSPKGTEVKRLRYEINALLQVADERDEVVIKLTSPGGMVNSYGLLSSQLLRLRNKGIYLTVCVDSVAASGGYLMACVANKIVAAPFAYIGSIGVVAEFPNFHRLLDHYQVDYEQVTAGKYKRTLSMLGPNTKEGRAKFKDELEAIHRRFKEQVLKFRPQLDGDKVATGEHWLAVDALELGLVDELATSEEYILKRANCTLNCVLSVAVSKPKKSGLQAFLGKLARLKLWSAFSPQTAVQEQLQRAESMEHIH